MMQQKIEIVDYECVCVIQYKSIDSRKHINLFIFIKTSCMSLFKIRAEVAHEHRAPNANNLWLANI
jgi:hypothetical protein